MLRVNTIIGSRILLNVGVRTVKTARIAFTTKIIKLRQD